MIRTDRGGRFDGWRLRLVAFCLAAVTQPASGGPPRIGINLSSVNYFGMEVPFTDALRSSQVAFAQRNGAGWQQSTPGAVTFGPDGYPTSIAPDHTVGSLWDIPPGYPGGPHALLWDGTGDVEVLLSQDPILSDEPGRVVIDIPATRTEQDRKLYRINSTDPNDPVRNLRLVPLAEEANYAAGEPANPFRQPFLDRWARMGSFRYMDWTETNNSEITRWDERPKPGDQTQGGHGVALEYQILHANTTRTHPWFNIPHLADDDYIRNAATLIRDTLDPNLVARIEFSNEVWNSQFDQTQYARQVGGPNVPGATGNEFRDSLYWYSQQSVRMFDIFEDVFTEGGLNPKGMDRLVRVMATQASNDWTALQALQYEDAYLKTDALAIAPYFGDTPRAGDQAELWKSYTTWEQRIARVEEELQEALGYMDEYATLLTDPRFEHLDLFAYEGGQHFVGFTNTHSDAELTQLMQDLSRRPEMRDFYRRYLEHWESIGGDDFVLFSSMGEYNRFGSWGHLEFEGQDPATAYKLLGVYDYLDARAPVVGDYNGDGAVDGADYLTWRSTYGSTADLTADGNGNGQVDAADYVVWRDAMADRVTALSVPEPTSLFITFALAGWALRRER